MKTERWLYLIEFNVDGKRNSTQLVAASLNEAKEKFLEMYKNNFGEGECDYRVKSKMDRRGNILPPVDGR